ncbi:MAG: PQQ-binding-like beta-propeller repeat protein [Verrucomicrobiales bacterium]|nr:PQQ-binding-like beta-propeller repeat protein [Verrucomicrobiales bacterium]
MIRDNLAGILVFLFFTANQALADWPQWRGAARNGVAEGVVELPVISEENTPEQLWVSSEIPSDHDGGHGSLSVSKGKVIVAIVWHRDEPTEKRQFTRTVLGSLGHRGTGSLDPAVVEKMEDDRINLSRRLRGKALDDYAKKWVEENLNEKAQLSLGSWVAGRFKKGASALPLTLLNEIDKKSKHVFQSQAELEEWVSARDWTEAQKAEVLSKVPDTEKLANDVILALDKSTGEEIWKYETPGHPSGRGSSSTPAVSGGKVYAALSSHIHCVDEATGQPVWKTALSKKGPASSPMVVDGKVFLQQGKLTAFDAATGEVVWENKDVKSNNSSPNIWKNIVVCNSTKELIGVNKDTGETVWKAEGGGDATPVVFEDYMVVPSRTDGSNLIAYKLTGDGPEKLWSKAFNALRYGSSAIIHDGYVYHLGSARHWCINLQTGEVAWERIVQSQISSPILADGKLLVYENRGGLLSMIEATPEDYNVIGKTKVAALYCASPALVDRDIFFRTKDSVKCFRLK